MSFIWRVLYWRFHCNGLYHNYNNNGSTTFSLALTAVLTAHCCAKHPLDLGVTLLSHEGDSAYLPCSYPQSSSLTILWRIKGSVYPVYHLPNGFERIPGSYSGLFLKDVSLENSGNYTCFIYNNSGLEQLYTVQFIVLPSLNISKGNLLHTPLCKLAIVVLV